MGRTRRIAPPKERVGSHAYAQLWRVVDGAVIDAMKHHPEYFRAKDKRAVRNSINKRVVGSVLGYVKQLT